MTDYTTSKDGTRIAYDRLGQGPPLVIVNGAMSVRTFVFARKMAEELAKSFTVYNYDRRGRGDSGDTAPFTVAKEVEDVAAICQVAGGKPYVVAFSSGAALALEAAAAQVPIAGLYAYEPPYINADPAKTADAAQRTAAYQATMDDYIAKGDRDGAVSYFMRFVGVPGFGVFVMKRLPMWKVMKGAAHTLPYDARIMNGFDVPTARFAKIKVPTIVGAGEKTTPALKAGARAAGDAIPKAKHDLVAKSNHGIKPEAMATVLVREFGRAG